MTAPPRILRGGDSWRIVRMTNPETGEVKDVLEVTGKRDAMGVDTWHAVDGNRDGIATYMRVINALVQQLTQEVK